MKEGGRHASTPGAAAHLRAGGDKSGGAPPGGRPYVAADASSGEPKGFLFSINKNAINVERSENKYTISCFAWPFSYLTRLLVPN